jgi:hypothetical protein
MKAIKLIVPALFLLAASSINVKAQSKAESTASAHAVYGGNQASSFKAKKKKKAHKRKPSSHKDAINDNRRKSAWAI